MGGHLWFQGYHWDLDTYLVGPCLTESLILLTFEA